MVGPGAEDFDEHTEIALSIGGLISLASNPTFVAAMVASILASPSFNASLDLTANTAARNQVAAGLRRQHNLVGRKGKRRTHAQTVPPVGQNAAALPALSAPTSSSTAAAGTGSTATVMLAGYGFATSVEANAVIAAINDQSNAIDQLAAAVNAVVADVGSLNGQTAATLVQHALALADLAVQIQAVSEA